MRAPGLFFAGTFGRSLVASQLRWHIGGGASLPKSSSSLKQGASRALVTLKKGDQSAPLFRRGWINPHESTYSHLKTFCTMANQEDRSSPSSMGPLTIDVCGKPVPLIGAPGLSESHVKQAVESNVFKQWIKYMTGHNGILNLGDGVGTRCSLKKVTIQNVDFFGSRVGFVKFKAEVIDEKTGAKLPGIVFGRGGAVGVLMLLECEGEKYAILTEQARVPVGRTLLELPAGMLDSDIGDFVGTAAREIEEETGIRVQSSDLVDLTALLDESTGRKMFPSPGGSDEDITLFLYRSHVDKKVIESLQGAETGLRDHGELIKVKVLPYTSLWRSTADSKALAAIAIYELASREGILPPAPNAPELSNL